MCILYVCMFVAYLTFVSLLIHPYSHVVHGYSN